jgi:hypothetical protein
LGRVYTAGSRFSSRIIGLERPARPDLSRLPGRSKAGAG